MATIVLSIVGFDGSVLEQAPGVARGIGIAFPMLPVVVLLISLIGLAMVAKVREPEKAKIRAELQEQHAKSSPKWVER